MADPTVRVEQGQLRGKKDLDCRGNTFCSFKGIPYAKPPLGRLRFKAPLPVEPWNGIRDATEEGQDCYSRHMVFQTISGAEDCLYLNVYTPQLPKNNRSKLKSVMVWIHGGGFNKGTAHADFYGPQFLVAEDVVLVTINYRIGLLGFFSLENGKLGVPGNAGFKDMVLALKWIQKNISAFGGDPKNVTIFGESAGGASAHMLMLSPMAKDLFHKVIAQSGCGLNLFALAKPCVEELSQVLGLQNYDEAKLLKHLQELPIEKLFEAQEKLIDPIDACKMRPYGAVVEKSKHEAAFLPDTPLNLILAGKYNKMPLIIGYTARDGMLFEVFSRDKNGELRQLKDFERNVPYFLKFPRKSTDSKYVAQKIKEFYYGQEEPSDSNVDKYYMLNTDIHFLRGIYSTIRNQLANSTAPIYLYRFTAETNLNFYKIVNKINPPGACHADELGYLFKTAITPDIIPGSIEDISIKRMTKLWANFAKKGNPNSKNDPLFNVTWDPVRPEKLTFLDIGENLTIGTNPDDYRMAFWDEVYKLNPMTSKL